MNVPLPAGIEQDPYAFVGMLALAFSAGLAGAGMPLLWMRNLRLK